MKVAIIGSRGLTVKDIESYLPDGVTEIISGGARGIDACAKEYAASRGITYTEFKPDYARYKRGAPLKRNLKIIDYADEIIAFWDGVSRGTKYTIDACYAQNKKVTVHIIRTGTENPNNQNNQ